MIFEGSAAALGSGAYRDALLATHLIGLPDMTAAIAHADRSRVSLAASVVALGLVEERRAYELLAAAFGLTLVDLTQTAMSPLAVKLVPERVARRHMVIPIEESDRGIVFATARVHDLDAEQDVAFASGRQARSVIALPSQISAAIERAYSGPAELDRLVARLQSEYQVETLSAHDAIASRSAIITICDHLLGAAAAAGASDIHIEPTASGLHVRYRVAGLLDHALTLPAEGATQVVNRFKVLAKADISVRNRPQDGAFRVRVNGRVLDIRLSSVPTAHGEKLVMRVIDGQARPQTFEALGYGEPFIRQLRHALDRPDGLVLVTGPTGSGKTSLLYSALDYLKDGHRNIVSVEDPVERHVDGVNQIPVNEKGGTTFQSVLRAVLRQDPNVIMVGEVRDSEVAQIVGQAAYTGHLVLTSLHTTDCISAITRLLNLGLEPYRIAESLAAIVSQRLVRRICPRCVSRAGCTACRFTGYLGRLPITEIVVPTDSLREAIGRGASAQELRAALRQDGVLTLRDNAAAMVTAGLTTSEDVNRVLAVGESPAVRTATRPRVVVGDDDPTMRMLVRLVLEQQGYEVVEASNGAEAVQRTRAVAPDLVILDLHMPELDGYGALKALRANLATADVPVMVLTAERGPGTERAVLELGADDYLVKPFEPPVLIARVQAVLRRQKRIAA